MTVYVDDYEKKFGRRLKLSHMVADTLEELHEMADRIGMKREWFQDTRSGPHYDVSITMKKKAIDLGAVPVTVREMARMVKNRRETGSLK